MCKYLKWQHLSVFFYMSVYHYESAIWTHTNNCKHIKKFHCCFVLIIWNLIASVFFDIVIMGEWSNHGCRKLLQILISYLFIFIHNRKKYVVKIFFFIESIRQFYSIQWYSISIYSVLNLIWLFDINTRCLMKQTKN